MSETREQRSRIMKAVHSKNTAPEMIVRRFLHAAGLRYRLHYKDLPGTPDLVFPGRRVAIFVNGCFWHQHPGCPMASRPKSRTDYWNRKLDRNVERDKEARRKLEEMGWKVLIVWECQLRNGSELRKICSEIKSIQPKRKRGQ